MASVDPSRYFELDYDPASLEADGYLGVTMTKSMSSFLATLFDVGKKFFANKENVKCKMFEPTSFEGYRNVGQEYSEVAERPDLCESFSARRFNKEFAETHFSGDAVSLHRLMVEFIEISGALIDHLTMRLECKYTGRSPSGPRFSVMDGSHAQLNYYSEELSTRKVLQDPHEDGLYFTLTKATAPGLEIQSEDKNFTKPKISANQVLIMPGEIASLISGYKIRPLVHRVIRDSESAEDRQSIMLFSNPTPREGERIVPWIRNEKNERVDIMKRAIENPEQFGLPQLPVIND